jgi:hypothetical protein
MRYSIKIDQTVMQFRLELAQEFDNIYQKALRYARKKTNNQVHFPNTCPYSLDELLDPNWLPPYE